MSKRLNRLLFYVQISLKEIDSEHAKLRNQKTLTKLYHNESNKRATYRRIITLFLTKPSSS